MSTCCWCTPGGVSTVDFLQRYASKSHSSEFQTADEDLCYCLECVAEYHKARDDLPFLHEVLWELETLRLINHFEKSMKAEIGDDDELYIVDNNGEAQLFDFTGQDFENKLRVPLLEILKYPYLLLHERVNELCVEALCRMEQANCSFQVFDKHPGIYLFLVHPNEMVRRWAILTARNLGKVDRDDYYDLQEVLTCLFKVIELGLLESPDIYTSSVLEKGKLILLPSHMYDTTNYKNYWLGICMLLTILEEQAMDSLLLGSDKQNDFMQSILHTMERQADDDSVDPFWPALHCFMVILDRLGSKVWGQRIDPIEAFQTIINNGSYNKEIQNIRNSSVRTKLEPESYLDDMVTCSQIVYNYNPEKTKKDSGWRSAICPDYCPNMYEEMETLASVLQSDIGQDMRVHNSTFLWFIPFVQSLMDLKDLGVAYIVEVIHHLHSEVKDVLNQTDAMCDKVTEFFLLILVSVIELHRNKKCLHLLWVSSQQWVEAVVKCAKLPTTAFARGSEKSSGNCSKGTAMISSLSLHSMPSNSVQLACVQLIRSLLKEGYQLGQQTLCKRFWDKLNLFLRGNLSLGWQLTTQETHELQTCLKQIIRNIKVKVPQCSTFVDLSPACKSSPASYSKEESEQIERKSSKDLHCLENLSPTFSKEPMKAEAYQMQENILIKASNTVEEDNEQNYMKDWKLEDHFSAESCMKKSSKNLFTERAQDQVKVSTGKQKSVKERCTSRNVLQNCTSRNGPERGCDRGIIVSTRLLTDSSTDALGKASTSNEDFSLKDDALGKTSKSKTKARKDEICAKLSHVIKKQHRKSTVINNTDDLEENLTVSNIDSFYSRKDSGGQKEDGFMHNLSLDPNGILDDKNGEQKSQNSLLLKKKQLKSEELDVFSSHENSYQIQERHIDDKDLVSFTEVTNTAVKKTSPFKDPVTLLESRDKEISKNTSPMSSHSREQAPGLSPQSDTLTDSQIDRDLHKLSLIAQASVIKFPSDSTQKSSTHLQRRVKDDRRCFPADQNNTGEASRGQIIIISDSDDDDDDDEGILGFEKHIKQDKIGIRKECPEQHTSTASTNVEKKLIKEEETKSLLQFEESDSQFFEFESPCEVFSVWQDQEPEKNSVQENEKNSCSADIADITNDWGYETDYVSEEVIKKVAEGIEKHTEPQSTISVGEFCEIEVKKRKRKRLEKPVAKDPLKPSPSDRNEDQPDILNESGLNENDLKSMDLRTASPSSSVQRDKDTTVSLKKSSPKLRTYSKPIRRVPLSKTPKKTHSDTKKGQNKGSNYISCRTTPAIVPPKKFRQCPEPTSTVEKLGLKKAPRRAFELSQRSLEYLVQLRDHGKTVGVVDTRKKTKLISPQTLSVKNNKKLLTSQDLQMRRQMRPKSQQNRQGLLNYESKDATRAGPCAAQNSDLLVPESDGSDYSYKGGTEVVANNTGKQLIKSVSSEPEPMKTKYVSQVTDDTCLLNQCAAVVLNGRIPTNEIIVSASADPLGGGDPTVHRLELATLKDGEPESNSDTEDENIFLTQLDPEDMDLCSQMENGNEKLIEVVHGKDTAQVEDSVSRPQLESWSSTKCKHKDCIETPKNQGEYCSKHCEAKAADEDVFRKPGLPISASKPSRPSTAKVFSSSSTSRIASLSKSLESTSALSPALKNKSNGAQAVLKVPQPASLLSPKSVGEVKSLYNVLRPQTPNNSNRQAYKLTFGESKSFSASSPVDILLSSQSISDTFVKEVLKWKYEMFVNFDQCGPPASLCQSISRPVPVRFQDCGDYFNVFFPLMVLNTFETVAQEWISSPNKEKFYQLHLRKFPADYKKYWEFVVHLEECELAKQFHPKENDLVFLVPERQNGEKKDTERNRMQDLREYHCGYVHKFRRTSVMRNGKSECSLSIQTQDNLSLNLNELVKCVVISSLVTTQRKLKAMSLLSGRNQLARAVLNPNPMDFCTKDLLTTTSERIIAYLRDFNEDQKKAIETAYAMVKHSPSVAKICLIHGPPGTGKSKTIVGLLYRLLTENQRKGHSDENSNAKIKQNRVLVCAPSNAAVDELMKKIILEFKEKCKDKKNPLGNCGDINLVRLGPEKSINNEVLKFSLDSQVNHRMKKDLPSHVQEMHRRKEFLDHQLDELSRQRALCRGGREIQRQELDEKIAKVSKERQELASKIKEVQGRPQKTQSIIILESHVICCTLSTSGGLLLESAFRGQGGVPFSCVIVDEAGQSCEVETLTPLIHRCNKLILVGDPKQLPPTVISMKAQEYGYDQSMMARFYKLLEDNVEHNMIGRLPILQLTVQYRMHPDICLFPSNYVYNRSLKTNRQTETNRCSSDWPFQPYLVFDVGDGSERRDNDSYVNVQEIKLVMEIIKLIKDKRRDVTFRNIGIITHYKAQKTMIQKDLDKEFDRKGPAEVDTVDGFQGRQKDCVIVTCVRANTMQGSIGFLASLQRLNVTITRAKYSLFILGHLRTLMENQHWNHLIQDAQKRGAIIKTCDKNYRHDAAKILKLKPVLQRSLTHPPAAAPEASRPQGGLPSNKLDSEFAKTSFTSSLYHTPSDSRESTGTVTTKDPERPLIQDRLRDPRLLRRMGLDPEAKGTCLRDPQPSSPQQPGATPPSGEPGFPGSHQDPAGAQQSAARGAAPNNHRPHVQCEPPAAGTDVPTSRRRCDWEGGLSHRRETRAFSEGDKETWSPESHHSKRNPGWDKRGLEKEDSGSKKRRLL
ncbi:probable helicase senataxin isoform X1 [Ursus arctos]|uniref:probable helicase senataxin isoform X1 n=1 Tax=Ursus arctos TaxID=9644 RepID=UPI0025487CB6|nr:probable helicase senataxin isoform X1 [Ursus arctos]XP_026370023.3 probable helicase senataxin isoform X1 [Ursus arctos]XP_026370024.3 probable helicase senataxin isoform X1 [Ursus arctos]XP_026370025.3 probable helicase senataxin isoform X1 [Ursus arctos]XP_048079010.2 probable helicase senataxin isoform X1 [Ursus arctos]